MVAPERPVFIGHVWMTGGPWLIADRLDGETWTGIDGDYQEEILPLTAWDTEISFGDWRGARPIERLRRLPDRSRPRLPI